MIVRAGSTVVELDPLGGRISRLSFDGHDVLLGRGDEVNLWGAYPMVPWAGRLGEGRFEFGGQAFQFPPSPGMSHAIHGLGTHAQWEVDGDAMVLDLDGRWPFGGVARVAVEVSLDDVVATLSFAAGEVSAPAVLGWHPCLRRTLAGAPAELLVEPVEMWERGADHLPTGVLLPPGERPWDDCFRLAAPPAVSWPGIGSLTFDALTDVWVLFDERDDTVCVEPQTGPPNGFNLAGGAQVVEPGEELTLPMTLRWQAT